ncbi:MAG: YdeI/OmpD-associated family protein [Reyranella sp.]|nr:YdeI/OmpD-associated family protein [Reyranella sp.]
MSARTTLDRLARVEVVSRAQWRAWLSRHHGQTESVWVVTWKKGRGPHVPYGDIRDEALCFGWIDSRPARLDEDRSMILLSPRKPGSGWSGVNKARVAVLEAEGRMAAPGHAKVEAARRDGSWVALDTASALTIPSDLARALGEYPRAAERFAAFPPSARRGILEWIAAAKRPETRARRIAETASLAARGVRANHPAGKTR